MIPDDLLDKVRNKILIWRVTNKYNTATIGLSRIEHLLDANRGHIQHCLSLLAKEGIMFERTKPEAGVARYEHGETDKYFTVRISKEDAEKKLKEMGVKYNVPDASPLKSRNKYDHHSLYKM